MRSVGPIIEQRIREQRLYTTTRKQFASVSDKPSRARTLQARLEMGKVFLPTDDKPWVTELISEMLTFPAGKHDDQVDALALLCRVVAEIPSRKMAHPGQRRWRSYVPAEGGY